MKLTSGILFKRTFESVTSPLLRTDDQDNSRASKAITTLAQTSRTDGPF
jgi:hypothetical protein